MKKYYKTEKYKNYNSKRAFYAIKKLQEKNYKNKSFVNKSDFINRITVDAPLIFSIVNNTQETLEFFENVEKIGYVKRQLFINIKQVKEISPESILYLLLFLEKMRKANKIKISGNAPADEKCRKIFLNSGFYDFVDSSYQTNADENILSIKSDNLVDGAVADEVIEFALSKLPIKRGRMTRAFYTTVLECMGNTKEWAYDSKTAKYAKWWLIAHYEKEFERVRFSILDNGKGIPETVRKKLFESIFGFNDSKILNSVLKGDFRTSTELNYRGKGLPKIMSFSESHLIKDLVVISNNGCYNSINNKYNDISPKFNGTMISWSFVMGDDNENISA
ncbi:MAG: hypothetical protein FWD14_07630 [Treponema sp.]|nr:hypothetical protein [Treponema sp.]